MNPAISTRGNGINPVAADRAEYLYTVAMALWNGSPFSFSPGSCSCDPAGTAAATVSGANDSAANSIEAISIADSSLSTTGSCSSTAVKASCWSSSPPNSSLSLSAGSCSKSSTETASVTASETVTGTSTSVAGRAITTAFSCRSAVSGASSWSIS